MFSPFLNKLIKSLNKTQMRYLIILNILAFSLWGSIIPFAKTWNPEAGNGILWFFSLYIVGAYIRLYLNKSFSPCRCIILFLGCMLAMYIGGIFIEEISIYMGNGRHGGWIINSYTSIIMVVGAVSLFVGFINITINNALVSRIICFIASGCFGVYLIHEQPEMRNMLWNMIERNFVGKYVILTIVAVSLTVFVIFILIEKLRIMLNKTIKVYRLEYNSDIVFEWLKKFIRNH